jgi:hypothetical protein
LTSGAADPADVRAGMVLLENLERTGRFGGPRTLVFSDDTLEVDLPRRTLVWWPSATSQRLDR